MAAPQLPGRQTACLGLGSLQVSLVKTGPPPASVLGPESSGKCLGKKRDPQADLRDPGSPSDGLTGARAGKRAPEPGPPSAPASRVGAGPRLWTAGRGGRRVARSGVVGPDGLGWAGAVARAVGATICPPVRVCLCLCVCSDGCVCACARGPCRGGLAGPTVGRARGAWGGSTRARTGWRVCAATVGRGPGGGRVGASGWGQGSWGWVSRLCLGWRGREWP